MGYLRRVVPNKTTTAQIQGKRNEQGQLVDPNTGKVLEAGKMDRGHKPGYEERVMRKCAERCHMTQEEYNRMMQNPDLYQWEDSHNNRSHQFECKRYSTQLDKCIQVIREFMQRDEGYQQRKQNEREVNLPELEKKNHDHFREAAQSIKVPKNAVKSQRKAKPSARQSQTTAKNGEAHSGRSSAVRGRTISGVRSGYSGRSTGVRSNSGFGGSRSGSTGGGGRGGSTGGGRGGSGGGGRGGSTGGGTGGGHGGGRGK